MLILSLRKLNLFACLACILLLLLAYFLEYVLGVLPCSLCILQRILFFLLAVVFLVAVLHKPQKWGARIYGVLVLLLASAGIWAAGRQVWLEYQPPDVAQICIPGLSYMLQQLPLVQTLQLLFEGQAACGQVTWRLLGLSVASWSLLCFILLLLFGLWQLLFTIGKRQRRS